MILTAVWCVFIQVCTFHIRCAGEAEVPWCVWCWGVLAVAHKWAVLPGWPRSLPSGSGWAEWGRKEPTADTAPSLHQSLWSGPETGNTGFLNLENTEWGRIKNMSLHGKKEVNKLFIKANLIHLNIKSFENMTWHNFREQLTLRPGFLARNFQKGTVAWGCIICFMYYPPNDCLSLVRKTVSECRKADLWYAAGRSQSACYRRPGWGTAVWPG